MKYTCLRCGCLLNPIKCEGKAGVAFAHCCTAEPTPLEEQVQQIRRPVDDAVERFEMLCSFGYVATAVENYGQKLVEEVRRLRHEHATDVVQIAMLKTLAGGPRPDAHALEHAIVQAIDIARGSDTDVGKRILSLLENALEGKNDR